MATFGHGHCLVYWSTMASTLKGTYSSWHCAVGYIQSLSVPVHLESILRALECD